MENKNYVLFKIIGSNKILFQKNIYSKFIECLLLLCSYLLCSLAWSIFVPDAYYILKVINSVKF